MHNLYVQTQVKVEIPPNEPDSQEFWYNVYLG